MSLMTALMLSINCFWLQRCCGEMQDETFKIAKMSKILPRFTSMVILSQSSIVTCDLIVFSMPSHQTVTLDNHYAKKPRFRDGQYSKHETCVSSEFLF